ncbi:MAG: CapA family protein [Christensenellales bacterium]|jgi:poly-gamma-glutamate capsule biosynthesis protein CapA/YwtB (metallophosphatase superfamily)
MFGKQRILAILLMLCMTLGMLPSALADEEISLSHFLTPAPAVVENPAAESVGAENIAPSATATAEPIETLPDGTVQIIVTAAGDTTIGGDIRKRGDSIFDKEFKKQNKNVNFICQNVKGIFETDDMTIVNFEGTLTTAPVYKTKNQFVFSAPPEYVELLTNGSIEAVALENNHVMDHGEAGLAETKATLDAAGIVWSDSKNMGVYKVKGVSIAMLTYQQYREKVDELLVQVPLDVARAKAAHDIVIVSFHWGQELDYKPNKNQINLGRATIDAGADLVLGHHSHRINPIERYKDKYIVYSLGNFSFAGNTKPSDMSTFLFQVRFDVKEGQVKTDAFRIIPCRISSKSDYNDFVPTPFTDQRHIDNVVNMLKSNSKNLEFAVEFYPLDWE